MNHLIDMHSHILHGVDDGSESYEMSVRMLKRAAADGVTAIILTPHNKPGHRHRHYSEMTSKVEELRKAMAEEKIPIALYMGSEVYYRSGILEEIKRDRAGTLAGSRYVLVEFNPLEDYNYIRNGIYSLLMDGYYPVLAHVERYQNVCAGRHGIEDLIEMGCYMQVNAGSITGKFGMKTKGNARNLLKRGQVHFVATDAHDLGKRPPCLSECADFIRRKYGEDYSRKLFCDNPMHVLKDKEITLQG